MEEIQNKWENKEYRQQYKREYIEKNREKINAYNRQYRKNNPKSMWCDCCQCLIKSGGGYQHRRTKKHQTNQELFDLKEQLNKKLN
jgi:hypothetical protein